MGDMDEGQADLLLDPLQLDLHLPPQLEVEGAQRLVQEQHVRAVHQCSSQRNPLLHAAGELIRLAGAEALELDELESLEGLASCVLVPAALATRT